MKTIKASVWTALGSRKCYALFSAGSGTRQITRSVIALGYQYRIAAHYNRNGNPILKWDVCTECYLENSRPRMGQVVKLLQRRFHRTRRSALPRSLTGTVTEKQVRTQSRIARGILGLTVNL